MSDDQPWLRHYDPGVPTGLTASHEGLYELLAQVVRRFPDTVALSYFGRDISYWRLKNLADAFATALYRRDIGPGRRIAVLLPNCPQFVIAFLGTLRTGAAVLALPPDLETEPLQELLSRMPCAVAVVLDSQVDSVKAAAPDLPLVVTSLRDYLPPPLKLLYPPRQTAAGNSAAAPPEEPDVRFLPLVKRSRPLNFLPARTNEPAFYSLPPGAGRAEVFSSAALAANSRQLAAWPGRVLKRGQERLLAAWPLHRLEGVVTCLGLALASAATLILTSRVRTEDVLAALTSGQPSILSAPAELIEDVAVKAAPLPPRRPITRSLRWALSVNGPLPPGVRQAFEDASDCAVVEALSLPETGVVLATPLLTRTATHALGLPLPGTRVRAAGGRLQVCGPQVFCGWYPEEGPATDDGWVQTTRPARVDPEGWVLAEG